MGIKTSLHLSALSGIPSEKPPHHMGIKTYHTMHHLLLHSTLKNLPTTWGLRLMAQVVVPHVRPSEKPPHHMGIKTSQHQHIACWFVL